MADAVRASVLLQSPVILTRQLAIAMAAAIGGSRGTLVPCTVLQGGCEHVPRRRRGWCPQKARACRGFAASRNGERQWADRPAAAALRSTPRLQCGAPVVLFCSACRAMIGPVAVERRFFQLGGRFGWPSRFISYPCKGGGGVAVPATQVLAAQGGNWGPWTMHECIYPVPVTRIRRWCNAVRCR
jgi:hypothetical protein